MSAMTDASTISTCLNLMRRLPPGKIEQNIAGLLNLTPNLSDELLQRIDQPLSLSEDSPRVFLLSDYNRDGDSHRSPWTNQYYPPIDDGFVPSARLRTLEVQANDIFESYREMYYEGGVSSVYLWDLDDDDAKPVSDTTGFAGCFLIKKDVAGDKHVKRGAWNSIHVVEVSDIVGGKSTYKLTTTIMISMDTNGKEAGSTSLSGSLTRQNTRSCGVNATVTPHLVNIGKLIEDMEIEMRSNMEGLYIQKTNEAIGNVRSIVDGPKQGNEFTKGLNSAVLTHGAGRKIDSES